MGRAVIWLWCAPAEGRGSGTADAAGQAVVRAEQADRKIQSRRHERSSYAVLRSVWFPAEHDPGNSRDHLHDHAEPDLHPAPVHGSLARGVDGRAKPSDQRGGQGQGHPRSEVQRILDRSLGRRLHLRGGDNRARPGDLGDQGRLSPQRRCARGGTLPPVQQERSVAEHHHDGPEDLHGTVLYGGSVFPVDSESAARRLYLHPVGGAAVLERARRSGWQRSRCGDPGRQRRKTVKTKLLIMVVVLFAGLAASDRPLFAHHGAAAYDMTKPVVLKDATVTEFLWINPHPLIKADFKDEQGNIQHWTMEMGSTVSAQLLGWTRTTLGYGDVVNLYVWQAKTKLPVGRFNKVEFSDGTVMRDTQTGADDGGRADT